jgi:hypothetical protein
MQANKYPILLLKTKVSVQACPLKSMAINKSGDFIATGDLRGNTHVLKLDEYWQTPRQNELGNVKKVIIFVLLFGLFCHFSFCTWDSYSKHTV